ncbi:Aste57867_23838 [Aphanomyces stellatus]|uniref:Aste57867_23838 protein n=1 Tax=Aphanomyces stellatus TaxID=120398 RepID=A0A485LNT6_9STRA|nr:hypothetical protein As57867_023765 [Aphanomyces stellatus]VFU00481.1 Aste57867_23838 [Aphanomyces stellatus]
MTRANSKSTKTAMAPPTEPIDLTAIDPSHQHSIVSNAETSKETAAVVAAMASPSLLAASAESSAPTTAASPQPAHEVSTISDMEPSSNLKTDKQAVTAPSASSPSPSPMAMPLSSLSVQASTATTCTSAAAAALVASTDVPRALGSSNVSPIAGDECRETTAGTMPLHDPVARDAGEGKPVVLVGLTAPPAGGERHDILEPRPVITQVEGDRSTPKNLPISDQENTNVGQSDHDERRNNNYVPIAPRQVVELSTTLIASRPDTDMTTPPLQELSYASVLQAAVEKTHGGDVKATLVRPSRAMLARLMELADDDTTTDEEMMQAIKEARPYTDREAKGTF